MDKYLGENLLDGERILWKGKSEPFKLLAPPYSRSLPLLWTVSLGILLIALFLFLPFARNMQVDSMQLLFLFVIVALVPATLCFHSIADKRYIEKHITYIFTNYRAISLTPKEINSMLINASTPYRLETLPDGNEILYIGDACNTTSYLSRENTITGIRKDAADANRITGLVFYGLHNAQDVCRQYTPFVEI